MKRKFHPVRFRQQQQQPHEQVEDESNQQAPLKLVRMAAAARHVMKSKGDEGDSLLPGLPDHLSALCLARVPLPTALHGVSRSWQRLLYSCKHFHTTRASLGHRNTSWLYTLIAHQGQCGSSRLSFSWYAFDPLSAAWHILPPMPAGVRFELSRPGFLGPYSHSIQCTNTGNKLIILAGTRGPSDPPLPSSSPSKSVVEPALDSPLVFDVTTATWSRGPRYTVPRRWCTCGSSGGKILVASGCGNEWDVETAKSAEIWDISSGRSMGWRTVESLWSTKLSREATSAVELDGKMYMVSARMGAVFDVERETWGIMPHGMTRGWGGSCVTLGGRVLAVDDSVGKVRGYNAGLDEWEVVAEHEMLKGLGNVVARNGVICGSSGNGSGVRVFKMKEGGGVEYLEELRLPVEGQVVGMQILDGMVVQ